MQIIAIRHNGLKNSVLRRARAQHRQIPRLPDAKRDAFGEAEKLEVVGESVHTVGGGIVGNAKSHSAARAKPAAGILKITEDGERDW